jgi:alkylhydroperoxidase family enzyme
MTSAQMSRFPIHDEENAPAESAALLKIASSSAGQLPNFLGVLAGSPAVLKAYLRFRQELGKGDLAAETRARIGLAVAEHFGSLPGATTQERAARAAGLGMDEIGRARRWTASDPAHATLLHWLKPLVAQRAQVPTHRHEAAREAGWTDAQLLEAVAVVALETLTAQVTVAGEIPLDGSTEETRQLRAVA